MPVPSRHQVNVCWADGQERTHHFAATGRDAQGAACTAVVYRVTSLTRGRVVKVVVLAPDATERAAVALPITLAVDIADAIRHAAGAPNDPASAAD